MMEQNESKSVLVVEDEAMIAMLLEDMLVALGHRVLGPVATQQAALELLQHERADAALLDINLGGVEVYPLAATLVERGVPFAFVTGYDNDGLPEAWHEHTLLVKPFRRSALQKVVEGLFNEH